MKNFIRNEALFGTEQNKTIINKKVLIVGLGGVGGYAAEAIARLGVKNLILVDYDVVEETNINRQIVANTKTLGQNKVDLYMERIKEINPLVKIKTYKLFVDSESIDEVFSEEIDYIIDAVDNVPAKILLIKKSEEKQIPIVSSMGMAKRLDSTQIRIGVLSETQNDKMAKKMRETARKNGLNLATIKVVYSLEPATEGQSKPLPSIVTVPAAAGLACATCFIKEFQKR